MKKLLLVLFFIPFMAAAQQDTIFTFYSGLHIGKIVSVDSLHIVYNKGTETKEVALMEVVKYTKDGVTTQLQVIDDLSAVPIATVSINDEMKYFKMCMKRHADQFFTGAFLSVSGFVVTGGGVALSFYGQEPAVVFVAVGATLLCLGQIVILDSHKWFRRAALGVTGTGAFVKYTF